MIPIHVIGIGLEGAAGLTDNVRQVVEQATLLVGSNRHLSYFPDHPADRLPLTNFTETIAQLHQYFSSHPPTLPLSPTPHSLLPTPSIVILTSGDPLFFGLGRLLLEGFPAEQLTFHPHLSSIQLAFSRIKLPWQDARIISAHGRSLDELTQAIQQGVEKIAVLTDGTNSPAAIAHLLQAIDIPINYRMWVCENLGGADERITEIQDPASLNHQIFAPLNVVVLQRDNQISQSFNVKQLPLLGIPDQYFLSFPDRPGLMTKREVRTQILSELALQPDQIIWDIGAGTGSVSIEMARLCPTSHIYAIEKTAIGFSLIQKNSQQFQVNNVYAVQGTAPDAVRELPTPDRIFIGGSGGNLTDILDVCSNSLAASGRMVVALATLEHLTTTLIWLQSHRFQNSKNQNWNYRLLQVQFSRSVPIADLTRFSPLNPVTLIMVESQ